MKIYLFAFSILLINSALSEPVDPSCLPNQIHLALGDAYYNVMYNYSESLTGISSNNSATITWQTTDECDNNFIQIYPTNNPSEITTIDSNDLFTYYFETYISDVSESVSAEMGDYITTSYAGYLQNLIYGVNYSYTISNGVDTVGPYTFVLPNPEPVSQDLKFVIYADVDTAVGNATLDKIQAIHNQNQSAFTAQLQLGDIGYNIFNNLGLRGEWFFNTIQNFSVTWPLMMVPGNHEKYQNYSFVTFRNRVPLFNQTYMQYYSWNVGKIHFLGVNYDYYIYNSTQEIKDAMMAWIKNDLEIANQNREQRPWIIVTAHRSLYCSYNSPIDLPLKRCYAFYDIYQVFDELWTSYNVDFVLQAHVHYWERMGPIAANQSAPYYSLPDDPDKHYIINAQAPIYTVDGSAGNAYFMVSELTPLEPYSINYDTQIGYSTLSVVNDSCLKYEHIISETGEVFDYFYMMKGSEYPMPESPIAPKSYWIYFSVLGMFVAVGLYFYCRKSKRIVNNMLSNHKYKDIQMPLSDKTQLKDGFSISDMSI